MAKKKKNKYTVNILWKDRRRRLGMPLSFQRYRLGEDRLFYEKGFFEEAGLWADMMARQLREGGEWALNDWQLAPYQGMIRAALKAYQEGERMPLDHEAAQSFAESMLKRFIMRSFDSFEE